MAVELNGKFYTEGLIARLAQSLTKEKRSARAREQYERAQRRKKKQEKYEKTHYPKLGVSRKAIRKLSQPMNKVNPRRGPS